MHLLLFSFENNKYDKIKFLRVQILRIGELAISLSKDDGRKHLPVVDNFNVTFLRTFATIVVSR